MPNSYYVCSNTNPECMPTVYLSSDGLYGRVIGTIGSRSVYIVEQSERAYDVLARCEHIPVHPIGLDDWVSALYQYVGEVTNWPISRGIEAVLEYKVSDAMVRYRGIEWMVSRR